MYRLSDGGSVIRIDSVDTLFPTQDRSVAQHHAKRVYLAQINHLSPRRFRSLYCPSSGLHNKKRKPTLNDSRPDKRTFRPAVFFDRDGTVIEPVHYLSDPQDVRLVPGVAAALSTLRSHGFALIVITNQSAIERGIIDEARLEEIHEELRRQLAEESVHLDGIYWCPIAPKTADRTIIEHEDRKPGPGMLKRAARELHLVLSESWMIGDAICDVLAGINAGCKGSIRVETGHTLSDAELELDIAYETVRDLGAAVAFILKSKPAQ